MKTSLYDTRPGKSIFGLKVLTSALLVLYLVSATASGVDIADKSDVSPVASPHDKLECNDCHTSHSMVPPAENSKPCLKCHEDQTGVNSHPVNVPHEGDPPDGLPLSKDGKLTCNTCHILHEAEPSVPALLRKKFNDLCMTCHFPDRESADASPHHKQK